MTSYLVDAVLLMALAFTSIRVVGMQRELARLRSYQGEFSTIVHETASAFDTVIKAAHDSTANLAQLAAVLNTKIDQAQDVIAALDARSTQLAAATGGEADADSPKRSDTQREPSSGGEAQSGR
jgi:ABC-type transporter Mla subunit MlaD